jgi:agarase
LRLNHPNIVGCNWFIYFDRPVTGNSGTLENHNFGFINVTDTPYLEMVKVARSLGKRIYQERFGAPGGKP